jgi:hypothetical protein
MCEVIAATCIPFPIRDLENEPGRPVIGLTHPMECNAEKALRIPWVFRPSFTLFDAEKAPDVAHWARN